MNSDDFVNNFISECIDNNIKSPKAICDLAQKEMAEIDEKLREFNKLRIRYKNLKSVLRQYDHESIARTKNETFQSFNENEDITEYIHYSVLIDICEFIESSESIITPREIMDAIGDRENSEIVYGCIKTLGDHGIVSRDNDRNIIKGPKWDIRPTKL
jgi:hypothetical protein